MLAAILARHFGTVPAVPAPAKATGTLQTQARRAVPPVPTVPAQESVPRAPSVTPVVVSIFAAADPDRFRVRCGDCRHFERDSINPAAGCGACGLGLSLKTGEPRRYPAVARCCEAWQSRDEAP